MLLAGPSMLSKLNPLNICRPRAKKQPVKPVTPPLSPSFLKKWKRSLSAPAGHLNKPLPKSPAVITRSQVKRASTLPSSQAMAAPSRSKLQKHILAPPDPEVQPYNPGGREMTSDYFMDVNLRLTNTNATTATSMVSDLSRDLAGL